MARCIGYDSLYKKEFIQSGRPVDVVVYKSQIGKSAVGLDSKLVKSKLIVML